MTPEPIPDPTPGPVPDLGVADTLSAAFLARVGVHPDQDAVICRSPRAARPRTTFAELRELHRRASAAFAAAGIGRGTRTAVLVRDPLTLIGSVYALTALEAVPVLLDPGLPLRRLKRCFDDVAPEAFLGGAVAHAARRLLGWGRHTTRITLRDDFARTATGDAPEPVAPDLDGLALLAFTSGSTGSPKAVQYTQRQLASQVAHAGHALGVTPGTVLVTGFAPFALYGPVLGATVVVPDMDFRKPAEVDPHRLAATIAETRASVLLGSPALLSVLARHCARHRVVLDTITCVASFGAPIPARLVDLLDRCVPGEARIRSVYGATECLPISAADRHDLVGTRQARENGAGTCLGRPLPHLSVRIVRPGAGPVPRWSPSLTVEPGEIGEITVSGPSVSHAYFGRPDGNAAAKVRDGDEVVHRTGDLGRVDAEGRLWFAGRKAHRVPTGPGHLDTEHVEPACDAVPGVRRTALVDAGVPVLCVELDDTPAGGDGKAVVTALRRRLTEVCGGDVVREVLVHPGLPVDIRHNAKIDRDRLARWARRRVRGAVRR
ncbi:AMP-binding protein [Saccharothrix sp. Mg75]|uniref:AMP-binding protein n=1 Tax=Saccharothrix sp. Mg75 TaxID=3445357 RepID=UPI003EEC598D